MSSSVTLYKPDQFSVHAGHGTSVGFCTVWNALERVLQQEPSLEDRCAIIGTLYGRQGVNVMIRNLALNPSIQRVYVWGNGALSQTKFGMVGRSALFALWEKGVSEDGTVPGTNFRVEKEIDRAVLDQVRSHVTLIDVGNASLSDAAAQIDDTPSDAYMTSTSFPDAELEAVDRWPSEEIGWIIRGATVVEAWQRVVQRVMFYGTTKGTQYGMQQKELIGVTWVVTDEDPKEPRFVESWPSELCELIGATQAAIQQYHQIFLSPDCPSGMSYTYGNRLMRYPLTEGWIDQIADVIVKQFRSSPDTRRGVATTMVPSIDKDSGEPPCLTQLQCLQSDGRLHALATFRSHDIFKAAIPNAFGLRMLQQHLCDGLGFKLGSLQITSQSAHIYEADWTQAKRLVTCAFTEREPDLAFRAEDADPRGNIIIHVSPEAIRLTLMGPDGSQLGELSGASARYLQRKLGLLDLFSKPDHLMDIGMELQKAQIAKDRGIPYIQDRPLQF